MTDTTPLQSFGSTEAGNAIIANEFSGPAHFNFHGGPGKRPAAIPPSFESLIA